MSLYVTHDMCYRSFPPSLPLNQPQARRIRRHQPTDQPTDKPTNQSTNQPSNPPPRHATPSCDSVVTPAVTPRDTPGRAFKTHNNEFGWCGSSTRTASWCAHARVCGQSARPLASSSSGIELVLQLPVDGGGPTIPSSRRLTSAVFEPSIRIW